MAWRLPRLVSQIAWRQRRSVSLLRKIHRAWRARTFTLRREQLGTRDSSKISFLLLLFLLFVFLISAIPRAVDEPGFIGHPPGSLRFAHLSRERRFPYSEYALRRTREPGSACRRNEVFHDHIVTGIVISTLKYIQEVSGSVALSSYT